MKTMAQFLEHFRHQREWTRRIVGEVPEQSFDWRPAKGAFSCGDLVRHLMQAEVFWCRLLVSAARGEALDPFGLEGTAEERMSRFREPNLSSSHDEKYGASMAECLERWTEIQQRTEQEFAALPDSTLHEVEVVHPLTGFEGPLWRMLLIMIEHEAHHRGQLSAYMKTAGLKQPAAIFGT